MEKIFSTHCSLPKQLQWPGQKQKPRDLSGSPSGCRGPNTFCCFPRFIIRQQVHKWRPGTQTGVHRVDQCCRQWFYLLCHNAGPSVTCMYIFLTPTSSEKCNKILASLACSHCLPACIPQTKMQVIK